MIVVCLKILSLKPHKGNAPVSLKSIPQSLTSNYPFVLKNWEFSKAPFCCLINKPIQKSHNKQCSLIWHRFEITIIAYISHMTKTTFYSSTHSNLLMDVVSFIEFMCFSLSLWMNLCCVQNFSPNKKTWCIW